jgi:hypothetical protein
VKGGKRKQAGKEKREAAQEIGKSARKELPIREAAAGWRKKAPAGQGSASTRLPGIPVLIVAAFCIAYALHLGALEPEIHFQKAPLVADCAGSPASAYASGNSLLFKMPSGKSCSAGAVFEGAGSAGSLAFGVEGAGFNVTKITVDGKTACEPCERGKDYPVEAGGWLEVGVWAQEAQVVIEDRGLLRRAFFEKSTKSNVDALVSMKLGGGWSSLPNEEVPSSFYGVDAPFHIHRVPVGASHLARLEWPWAEYTFISILPASAIYGLLGVSYQYAYKLWEIALLFLPVAVFYLLSRKLSRGQEAAFLLATLLYLCLPSQGMVMGGGADLFMYGMTAHTLATSLSLICLFFAYEFTVGRNGRAFLLAVLFCALAVASNQRIAISILIGLAALFALSLAVGGARRALLLAIACAAPCILLSAPLLLQAGQLEHYSVLGGASTESVGWAVVGFFQLGYFALPLLFAAGAARAFLRKEMFLVFLLADCVLVFAVATSPELNSLAPFLDGLRFMPSFFLPVFFIAGAGAVAAFEAAFALWEREAQKRLRLDRLDCVASFAFAILLPLAVLLLALGVTTTEQYRAEADSPAIAAEYSELEAAYGVIGGECVFFAGRGDVSQYPVFDEGLERTVVTDLTGADEIADAMESAGCRYLIFGNSEWITSADATPRWREYAAFANSGRFEEVPYGGSNRLLLLKGAGSATKVESKGARIDGYGFDFDRGSVSGECLEGGCALRVRNDGLPGAVQCSGVPDCKIRREQNAMWVDGIPEGAFFVSLAPESAEWFWPLAASCAVVVLACGYAAGKRDKE